MVKAVLHHIVGTISVIFYFLNTVVWATPILLLSVFKLIPIPQWRRFISYLLDACATAWIGVNNMNQRISGGTTWHVNGLEKLTRDDWYLVLANHQSWVDILVLQRVFNRKIPFLKFFLKKELIYVPILGLAWWALDFPFMRRYSKSFLAKNPHLKGKDMETTRKACEKFRSKPVSIMNFVEGTRFTKAKDAMQASPLNLLLKLKVQSTSWKVLQDNLGVAVHRPLMIDAVVTPICGAIAVARWDGQRPMAEVSKGIVPLDEEVAQIVHERRRALYLNRLGAFILVLGTAPCNLRRRKRKLRDFCCKSRNKGNA